MAKITPSRTDNLENPTARLMPYRKSVPRIDITQRRRDTEPISMKTSSFMNDVG
jgi:hypothetical protein